MGRFAQALRTQRTMSPRRKRALLVMAAVSLLGVVTVMLTLHSPELPGGMGAAGSAIMMHARAQAQEKQGTVRNVDKSATTATADEQVSARIVTCPACRLNSLPKVKAFVHGDAKLFPALKIKFEFGHDPELYLYEAGKVEEVIDLAPLDGAAIMQRLYKHGIRPSKLTPSVTDALGRDAQVASQ